MENFTVAIDGPAASGKSTISKIVATKIGFTHIDTGAMYRAVTLYALENNVDLEKEEAYSFLENIDVNYQNGKIYLGDRDVSSLIRTPEVTKNVSLVSSFKYVREKMVFLQQQVAKTGLIIMDGRDIGYKVLPNADLKLFLTASIPCRALRRFKEMPSSTIEEMEEDIKLRDHKDSTRKESPLKMADDAIFIDTTEMTIDEVTNTIIELIEERMN